MDPPLQYMYVRCMWYVATGLTGYNNVVTCYIITTHAYRCYTPWLVSLVQLESGISLLSSVSSLSVISSSSSWLSLLLSVSSLEVPLTGWAVLGCFIRVLDCTSLQKLFHPLRNNANTDSIPTIPMGNWGQGQALNWCTCMVPSSGKNCFFTTGSESLHLTIL